MVFANPYFLLLIAGLLLLLFAVKRREKNSIAYSFRRIAKETILSKILRKSEGLFWFLSIILLIVAFSRPQMEEVKGIEKRKARELFLMVDLSMSMGNEHDREGNYDPNSGISKIKTILRRFAKKRQGDFIGVGGFGGSGGEKQSNASGIIRLPVEELHLVDAAIDVLRSQMFGIYTATGEGLLVSVMGLTFRETKSVEKRANIIFDVNRIKESLTGKGNSGHYLSFFMRSIKPPLKNKAIILFTDGYYNRGIDPLLVFSLVKALGIKVYFVGVKPTSATGMSRAEGEEKKALIAKLAKETGGDYFDGEDYGAVERSYDRINELEKEEFEIERTVAKKELYFWPTIFGTIFFVLMLAVKNIWPKIC